MTFEIDPPDEPCPDCGSIHHRTCRVDEAFKKSVVSMGYKTDNGVLRKVWQDAIDHMVEQVSNLTIYKMPDNDGRWLLWEEVMRVLTHD